MKTAIVDPELEQSIHLSGLTPSGALAGSAPVNIPKGGCHQTTQFSPHSPCGVLGVKPVNEVTTTSYGIDSFSFGNQVNKTLRFNFFISTFFKNSALTVTTKPATVGRVILQAPHVIFLTPHLRSGLALFSTIPRSSTKR